MAVPYKNIGDALTAAEWNTIFAAIDGLQTNLLGGLSDLLLGNAGRARKFFFFNPVVLNQSLLHPLVGSAIANVATGYLRQYNHAAITGLVAALPTDPVIVPVNPISTDFGVVRLKMPTAAAWVAALYPEGAYTTASYGGVNLDICLSVLTMPATVGKAVTFGQQAGQAVSQTGQVELVKNLEEVEIIIAGNISFDPAWNKYSIFRIHNFGLSTFAVTFGTLGSVSVPSGQVRCARIVAGALVPGYNYFNKMASADPRFYQYGDNAGNLFKPMGALLFLSGKLNRSFDPAQFWDMTVLYNTSKPYASRTAFTVGQIITDSNGNLQTCTTAGITGVNAPAWQAALAAMTIDGTATWTRAGAVFPQPTLNSLIGDLCVGEGTFLCVRWGTQNGRSGGSLQGTNILLGISNTSLFGNNPSGTGYVVGEQFTYAASISNTAGTFVKPAIFQVDSVNSAGKVTAFHIVDPGAYSVPPNSFFSNPEFNTVSLTASHVQTVQLGNYTTFTVSQTLGPFETKQIQFTGFAGIPAALAQANSATSSSPLFSTTGGISWSFAAATGILTLSFTGSGSNWFLDLIDVSTNLISFLTGNTRWSQLSTASKTAALSGFSKTFTRPQRITVATVATNFHYNLFTFDGTNYVLGAQQTATVQNAAAQLDATDLSRSTPFTFMDAVQKLVTFLNGLVNSSAIVQNAQVRLSPFGATLCWQEVYPVGAGFNAGLLDMATNFVWIKAAGSSLIIQRAFNLAAQFNNSFAPLSAANPPWNFPRQNRRWVPLRNVTHAGADEPWQNTTTAYTTQEQPNVQNFYELKPVAPLAKMPAHAKFNEKAGFSRMGALDVISSAASLGADTSQILLALWLAAGGNNYEEYLDCVGDAARSWISSINAALLNVTPGNTPNATIELPNQTEQINVLASEVNGLVTTTAKSPLAADAGSVANGNFVPAYAPQGVPLPSGFSNPYGSKFFPRGCFYSWMAPATGDDAIDDYFMSQGLAVQRTLPDGFGAIEQLYTDGISTGGYDLFPLLGNLDSDIGMVVAYEWNGSSWSLPPFPPLLAPNASQYLGGYDLTFGQLAGRYRWITVDDARTLYSKFKIPFVVKDMLLPMDFLSENQYLSEITSEQETNFLGTQIVTSTPAPNPPDIGPETYIGNGLVALKRAGFIPDSEGLWVCSDFNAKNFRALSDLIAAPSPMTSITVFSSLLRHTLSNTTPNIEGGSTIVQLTSGHETNYKITNNWDKLADVIVFNATYPKSAILILLENTSSQAVFSIPENFADFDHAFNLSAYLALGTQIIPIIVDNTVENNLPEIIYLDGVGGPGAYEHIITTNLASAQLVVVPVDGQA